MHIQRGEKKKTDSKQSNQVEKLVTNDREEQEAFQYFH